MRTMLKAKIHRATVTEANVDYRGSITLDPILMEAANLVSFEQVHVLDITNGARLETYAIEGERGSGVVCLNGAAARLIEVGDLVIVLAFDLLTEAEVQTHKPILVYVDDDNRITEVTTEIPVATR